MRDIGKGVLGIILIIIVIAVPYFWENYGRELTMYEVVAFNQDTQKNTVISSDMLTSIKVDKKLDNAIADPNLLIGLETKNFIPKNCQLVKQFFDVADLVLEEQEFIFKIPSDWLKAFPSTLRRGDKVYIYEVKASKESDEMYANYEDIKEKTPICNATVAYVKDNANREVITLSEEKRYDGSSSISEIEIIVNQELVNQLYNSISFNNKFIIYYK